MTKPASELCHGMTVADPNDGRARLIVGHHVMSNGRVGVVELTLLEPGSQIPERRRVDPDDRWRVLHDPHEVVRHLF